MAEQSQQGAQGAQGQAGNIQVKVPPEHQTGVYTNAASVQVNTREVVLDFGYILPNVQPTTIQVVSRINMSHRTAESFMKVLQDSLLDWRNKMKERTSKKAA